MADLPPSQKMAEIATDLDRELGHYPEAADAVALIRAFLATPAPVKAADDVERVARMLCEQHGGDPDAVASEPHDMWEGALWTAFEKDARSILASLTPTPPTDVAGLVEALKKIAYLRPAGDVEKCANARKLVEQMEKIALSALTQAQVS